MMFKPVSEQLEILQRGIVECYSLEDLQQKLAHSHQNQKPLKIKLGVDPTSQMLHLGFTVVLRKLRQFQDLGHQAILIIGDYTARVGDPSGRNKTRPTLSGEEVEKNALNYLNQTKKILDPERLTLRYNGEWFKKLTFLETIELCSQMTVARMLERDDFKKRFQSQTPISLHEFIYPLMQGYDSVMIESDVELGGTDQTFNLLVGRTLQKDRGQSPQICMTLPILVGTDGIKKMSKSYGNTIGIDEEPKAMYDKLLSIPDSELPSYWTLLSDLPLEELENLNKEGGTHIQEVKKKLACEILRIYHGPQIAQKFQKGEAILETISLSTSQCDEKGFILPVSLLVLTGLAPSNNKARKLIEQGSFKINSQSIRSLDPIQVKGGEIIQSDKQTIRSLVLN